MSADPDDSKWLKRTIIGAAVTLITGFATAVVFPMVYDRAKSQPAVAAPATPLPFAPPAPPQPPLKDRRITIED